MVSRVSPWTKWQFSDRNWRKDNRCAHRCKVSKLTCRCEIFFFLRKLNCEVIIKETGWGKSTGCLRKKKEVIKLLVNILDTHLWMEDCYKNPLESRSSGCLYGGELVSLRIGIKKNKQFKPLNVFF